MIMMVSRWRVRDIIPIVWPEIIIYKNRQPRISRPGDNGVLSSAESRETICWAEETNVAIPDEATSLCHSSSRSLTSPNIHITPNSNPSTSRSRGDSCHTLRNRQPRSFCGRKVGHQCCFTVPSKTLWWGERVPHRSAAYFV